MRETIKSDQPFPQARFSNPFSGSQPSDSGRQHNNSTEYQQSDGTTFRRRHKKRETVKQITAFCQGKAQQSPRHRCKFPSCCTGIYNVSFRSKSARRFAATKQKRLTEEGQALLDDHKNSHAIDTANLLLLPQQFSRVLCPLKLR